MSISVTVSGDGSTQVTQSSAQNQSIVVSGGSTNTITATPASSASVIVTESPDIGSSIPSSFGPALAAQSSALASFQLAQAGALENIDRQLKNLTGTTETLDTQIASNASGITGVSDFTGVFDQKINLISGSVNTISGLANASSTAVTQTADNTLSISALQTDNSLLLTKTNNISGYITGAINPIFEKTGDFAVTGSDVTFKDVIISGDLLPSNANASLGNPSNRFRDIHLSSDSIFLGNSKISFEGAPSGVSGGLRVLAAGMSGRLLENTETGAFAATGSDVTFKNIIVSENILPENTGASLGSPTGRFKDLHLSDNSIFLGDSKISFSGGASGGLTITGSGLTGSGGAPKVIKLLGEDDEGRISVQNSLEIGRNIFLGDSIGDGKLNIRGPGPMSYDLITHADGFKIRDNDSAGDFFSIRSPFTPDDTIQLKKPTSVQGGFFTSSGVHHSADTDTAFLFPDINTASIETSGVNRLRVEPNGNVGIGTFGTDSSPTKKLHVLGDFQAHEVQAKKGLTVGNTTNTMISFISGISTVTNIGAAHGNRSSLVLPVDFFGNVPASGGAGSDATFNVTLDTSGAATISVSYPGNHYSVGETLTIADSDIGNGGAPDLTFDVETLTVTNGIDTQRIHAASDVSVSGSIAVAGGITSPSITSLNTATGVLNTNVSALQAVTGSFAQTGTDVSFQNLTVSNNIGVVGTSNNSGEVIIHTSHLTLTDGSIRLGPDGDSISFMGVSDANYRKILFADSDDHFVTNRHTNGDLILMSNNGVAAGETERLRFVAGAGTQNAYFSNANVGIGTTSPQAKLHVSGSGIVTSDFAVNSNTLFVDASQNSVGIKTSSPRAGTALHVDDNFLVTNGNEDHFDIDTTSYIYKLGDISGGENGSLFEINAPNGVASLSQAFFGIGVQSPQATLHVDGGAIVSGGLTTLGKTTLSSDAFVIETGSFTLGNTHKGATVLLQNSTSINITVPAQVGGYVTTFIAETHNSVSFVTGAGMSGLNSFQGASDMAGIYGQAQVIYKSAEYAFLGGNVV